MPDWRIPLADVEIGEAEIRAVEETYRSGWLSMGPRTEELERRFSEYVGCANAIAVTNGTAALHLICLAAGLGPGDEVIMPSLTFVATANAARYVGADPVFADIVGLERPWLSTEAAAAAIGPRTRAIINMTYGGHPGESAKLGALAREHDLVLLEDAAHGLGGRLGGRHLGSFGLAGAFSFFSNKNLPVGEGGMAVTDDEAVAERVRLARSHGMTSLTWDRHRGDLGAYDVITLGFNYRIDEPRAALASARLGRLDEDNRRRAEAARLYRERLDGARGLTLTMPQRSGDSPAHHLFTVVVDENVDRDRVRERLAAAGIQTSVHYPPVHRFRSFAREAAVPLTEEYARRAITLPLFPAITESEVDQVVEALLAAL